MHKLTSQSLQKVTDLSEIAFDDKDKAEPAERAPGKRTTDGDKGDSKSSEPKADEKTPSTSDSVPATTDSTSKPAVGSTSVPASKKSASSAASSKPKAKAKPKAAPA